MKGHPFTPSIEDDHDCQLRRSFATRTGANVAVRKIFDRTGKLRPIKSCRHCGQYHLGDAK